MNTQRTMKKRTVLLLLLALQNTDTSSPYHSSIHLIIHLYAERLDMDILHDLDP